MKYFIDTEFIEGFYKPTSGKGRHFIDLISIGIVAENGNEYYAISNEFNPGDADEWVKENVIKPLGDYTLISKPNIRILEEIILFIGNDRSPEFYGYYADYDWVLFCSIFGRMIDLPKGFPMYCKDLIQMMDEKGLDKKWKQKNCPDPEGEHNALVDAKWNMKLYNLIKQ